MATSRRLVSKALALACIAATSLSCRSSLGAVNAGVHSLPQDAGRLAAMQAAKLTVEIINECSGFPVPWIPWSADVSVRGTAGSYRVDRQLKVGLLPNGSHLRIESVPQNRPNSVRTDRLGRCRPVDDTRARQRQPAYGEAIQARPCLRK